MDDIGEEETLDAFLEVHLLKKSNESGAALRVLAQLQMTIESNKVSYTGHNPNTVERGIMLIFD